ncbi:MAG TPA: flagellar hook protein FlgE [Bryobacteraceae bacterium]|nr:flagellar hook protein FlgE [Bryobacteraceae bacterium]
MFSSFSTALAALKAHSSAVDTIGHNLANVNTAGFKASEVAFKDLVAQSMDGSDVGMGVTRPISVRNFTQGAIQSSGSAMSAAIQGDGFFIVSGDNNVHYYTRDGGFQVDRSGALKTLTGERVQGFTVAADGTVGADLRDIIAPAGTSLAKPTANMSVFANLNAATADDAVFSAPVEVIDSIGKTHVVTMSFTKTGENAWSMQASMVAGETTSDTPEELLTDPIEVTFDENGMLLTPELADGQVAITLPELTSGAGELTVNMNFYDPNGAPTLTQAQAASSMSRTTQDGVRAGQILEVGMADEGRLVARYDSGEERVIAILGIAITSNPDSLTAVGNNLFLTSGETAKPVIGLPGEGGRGRIKARSLEASTVDIAREFTNLIVYQRGYQANSRVITTADELSQETLNIKR